MLGGSGALSTPAATRFSRRAFALLIAMAITVFVADHLVKALVVARIPLGGQWPEAGPVVLHHIHNRGAAFGLFPQGQLVFLMVAVLVSGYILIAGHRLGGGRLTQVILGAILGGAAANAVDRLAQGYVVDYVDIHVWPIFNLADTCIVVGILAAILVLGPRRAQPGS